MYAKEITKEYLEQLGITEITPDGVHIYKNKVEVKQVPHRDGYLRLSLYDPELFAIEYQWTKNPNAGSVVIGVHRAVYAWFNDYVSAGMVVDHIDNNKTNNAISNLQLLTPGDNIWKDREHNVAQLKCKLNKPRSFYENKLSFYETSLKAAKEVHDAELAHKRRCNIAQIKARLRYWDAHNKPVEEQNDTK